jgi:hypothetical protein
MVFIISQSEDKFGGWAKDTVVVAKDEYEARKLIFDATGVKRWLEEIYCSCTEITGNEDSMIVLGSGF